MFWSYQEKSLRFNSTFIYRSVVSSYADGGVAVGEVNCAPRRVMHTDDHAYKRIHHRKSGSFVLPEHGAKNHGSNRRAASQPSSLLDWLTPVERPSVNPTPTPPNR